VIIDLIGEHGGSNDVPTEKILSQWRSLADLRAAKEGDVSVIRGDFTMRPGPRYPLALKAFIRAIRGGETDIAE
jgi:hypothetical protein